MSSGECGLKGSTCPLIAGVAKLVDAVPGAMTEDVVRTSVSGRGAEAAKGFRRLKAHKQLPILKAALAVHQAKHATNTNGFDG